LSDLKRRPQFNENNTTFKLFQDRRAGAKAITRKARALGGTAEVVAEHSIGEVSGFAGE
jgi:hypothetical protein